jgi:1-acyl-sn-glycerol-3-phosphate acyltransferase
MNYYKIACKYVTPVFRIFFNYKTIGGENLLQAALNGRVVVCTTHSSDLGGMIVGMAVSTILKTEPWIVVNARFRKNRLINFFLKDMNIIWMMGNDMLGNYAALREIRDLIVQGGAEAIIIAPQGTYNKPVPGGIRLRQGFAIPCIQAVRSGAIVNVVPAIDVGATYKGVPAIGRRIMAVFGYPMTVKRHAERTSLTRAVEKSIKGLMAVYGTLFGACCLLARIYAHCH